MSHPAPLLSRSLVECKRTPERNDAPLTSDFRRLPLTDQLRYHVRRGQHREALRLAVMLRDDDSARFAALRLIEVGAEWRIEATDRQGAEITPGYRGMTLDGLRISGSAPRWVILDEARVRALWDDTRARLFACACAEKLLFIYDSMGFEMGQRARFAIDAARNFALGKGVREWMRDRCRARVPLSVPDFGHIAAWEAQDAASHTAQEFSWAAGRFERMGSARCVYRENENEYGAARDAYLRNVLEPLLLQHMLLQLDELTDFDD